MNQIAARKKNRKELGQTLVEFALTLPVLLMFTLGTFDFGRVLFAYVNASNSLRIAVRQAPVIGYDSSPIPPYVDCDAIRDKADNVIAASVNVQIFYIVDSGGSAVLKPTGVNINSKTDQGCTSSNPVDDSEVDDGDLLVVQSWASITPVFVPYTIEMHFRGQRTIVKEFRIGGIANDSDYDGLDDTWEETNFGAGNLTKTALDDTDLDGCNEGTEETAGTDPNNVNDPVGGC